VASYGADANVATSCGVANPCRSFATAVTVVDSDGEVLALDSIGYGPVTLTQSISLVAAPGAYAGISVSSGNGVTIATAGINVTLRGLTINGVGGTNGVSMTNGAKLSIEKCVISNFSGNGVFVATAAAVRIIDTTIRDGSVGVMLRDGATAAISASQILGSGNHGVFVYGTAGNTTTLAIDDTLVTGNDVGVIVQADPATSVARVSVTHSSVSNNAGVGVASVGGSGTALLTLGNSTVTGNATAGLYQTSGGTLESLGNNTVRQNGANVGTITTVAPQ
jgi:hypothetical protein